MFFLATFTFLITCRRRDDRLLSKFSSVKLMAKIKEEDSKEDGQTDDPLDWCKKDTCTPCIQNGGG